MKKLLIFTIFLISGHSYAGDSEYLACDLLALEASDIAQSVGSNFGTAIFSKVCRKCPKNDKKCIARMENLLNGFVKKANSADVRISDRERFINYIFRLIIATNTESYEVSKKSGSIVPLLASKAAHIKAVQQPTAPKHGDIDLARDKLGMALSLLPKHYQLSESSPRYINDKVNKIFSLVLDILTLAIELKDFDITRSLLYYFNLALEIKMKQINNMINKAKTVEKQDKLVSIKIWNKFAPLTVALNSSGKYVTETLDQLRESSGKLLLLSDDRIESQDFDKALSNIRAAIKFQDLHLLVLNFYAYYKFLYFDIFDLNHNIQTKSHASDTKRELQDYLDNKIKIALDKLRLLIRQ